MRRLRSEHHLLLLLTRLTLTRESNAITRNVLCERVSFRNVQATDVRFKIGPNPDGKVVAGDSS